MKNALKIIGYVLGGIVFIILAVALFIQMSGVPTYDIPLKDITVEMTPEQVSHGAQLASVSCNHCHLSGNNRLDGKLVADASEGLGDIYGSNITQHEVYGIGTYTDAELYRLLRTGIKKDGKLALPMMLKSRTMADEDVYAIIAFLRSDDPLVQASDHAIPAYKPNFMAKFLYKIAFKPLPYPEEPVVRPDISDKIAYGQYLVDGSLICFDCHSASFETNDWMQPNQSQGYLGGGMDIKLPWMDAPVKAANITPDKEYGIGNYTEEQFIAAIKWGKKADGSSVSYPMLPYSFLDTAEVLAIYAYLKTVPPIGAAPEVAGVE